MVIDELKMASDDVYFTEEHIIYLLGKMRAFFLKKNYSTIKKLVGDSNYQELCIELINVPAIPEIPCETGRMLRSKERIPEFMNIGNPVLYPVNYYLGTNITLISRERMRYVGHNPYLRNIIYASIAPDRYLWLTSMNPQYLYLAKIRFSAVFEDPEKAAKISCDEVCDILDVEFPLEEAFIMPVIELVVQELLKPAHTADNTINNAADEKGVSDTDKILATRSSLGSTPKYTVSDDGEATTKTAVRNTASQ